jgi:hypothetical protein
MKKLLLLKLCVAALFIAGFQKANAQFINILDARLIVDEPASISGVKGFTFSSNPDGAGPWGRALDSIWKHVEVVKAVTDSTACSNLDPSVAGKWVLIYRGGCEFGEKAAKAQNAGAKGVIIWNHTVNELINMAAGSQGGGVTIPVLFISNADGKAINSQLSANQKVYISLTRWGFDMTHDLAIVPASQALATAGALPLHQLDGTDIPAYRSYTGAYVANTGKSQETNVFLKQEATFTPTGGSASTVFTDSTTVGGTFNTIDSIIELFSPDEFKLAPTSTGRYNFTYSLYADSTDGFMSDNTTSSTMEVTSNAFCKSRFDVATQRPIATTHLRLSSTTTELTFGPLFFNRKGNYALESVVFSIADQDTSKHTLNGVNNGFIDLYVFKWVDANTDRYMQSSELTLKSIAIKQFTTADSNKHYFQAMLGDAETGKPSQVVSEDNTWYWVAANLSNVFGLGCDGTLSYYNRANAAQNHATNKRDDFWAPAYSAPVATLRANTTDTVRLMPFNVTPANSNNTDSAGFANQVGSVPSVALYTSPFPVKVADKVKADHQMSVFPNPATDKINVKFNLDKTADKVHIKVIDAFGRNVFVDSRNNVKQDNITISTSGFAAGNYYVILVTGETAISKPFTITK